MNAPLEIVQGAASWTSLTRWERAELGRSLRRAGWTYSEIMNLLPVGKSTLAGWCKDIRLTEEQVDAIKARRPPGIRTGIPVDTQRKRRAEDEMLHDTFWIAGVVMYWAEGTKARPRLEVANSDDRALRLFIGWTRRYHRPDAEFVLELHLHEGNDDNLARSYWVSTLGLSDSRFYPTFIKPAGTGHRKNTLRHGVCRVSMTKSTDAFHRTIAWIDAIADFPGASRD